MPSLPSYLSPLGMFIGYKYKGIELFTFTMINHVFINGLHLQMVTIFVKFFISNHYLHR
jgi:hypothetical protein